MIIATLGLVLALQTPWTVPPLYPRLFPNPTGANGIEDYTLAMDVLRAGHYNVYKDWQSLDDRSKGLPPPSNSGRFPDEPSPKIDPRVTELLHRLSGLNLLELREEESKEFGRAMTLIASGNAKSQQFPGAVPGVRFPPISDLFALTDVACDSAYEALSRSRGNQAAELLSQVMLMSDRMARWNDLSVKISMVDLSKIFLLIKGSLDRYSIEDAKVLEDISNAILGRKPACIQAFRNELLHAQGSVRETILADRQNDELHSNEKGADAVIRILKSNSDIEIDAMIQRTQQAILEKGNLCLARVSGPEENWLFDIGSDEVEFASPPSRTLEDVEKLFTNNWTPPFARNLRELSLVAISRCQLRLVRLYAQVIRYRWEWNRLPRSLDELQLPSGYDYDLLSKQRFVYEQTAKSFRIYSKGWRQTGVVDLGYGYTAAPQLQEVRP